jgi:hypothetical protein
MFNIPEIPWMLECLTRYGCVPHPLGLVGSQMPGFLTFMKEDSIGNILAMLG